MYIRRAALSWKAKIQKSAETASGPRKYTARGAGSLFAARVLLAVCSIVFVRLAASLQQRHNRNLE
jgi:hypothetical protein